MRLGFHTGSLLLHDEVTASEQLAKVGYQCVAVRPRLGGLLPSDPRFSEQLLRLKHSVEGRQLDVVIDTRGRFIHDPNSVFGPSLADQNESEAEVARRGIESWLETASEIGAHVVTFAAGKTEQPVSESVLERLARRIELLLGAAGDVKLAIQPVTGNAIATVAEFERIKQWLNHDRSLLLAADVGEMLRGGEFPVGDRLARNLDDLACVYLCEPEISRQRDARVGLGDLDFTRVIEALVRREFGGPVIVRVDGHHELGLQLARESYELLADSANGARNKGRRSE